MKKLVTLILAFVMVPTVLGQVSLQIFEADGVTPFDCNSNVMVGSKLVFIVISDSNDNWSGGLFIVGQDRALGTLAGRDKDPISRDWTGSHYADAGDFAKVTAWRDSSIWGFDLYTFLPFYTLINNFFNDSTVPGNWFVIDYYADEVGEVNVGFYEYNDDGISWREPNYIITFHNVPTRDLNSDEAVDFRDFAIFSSQWNDTGCGAPNWCAGADLDRDGDVDHKDLGLFVEYWLWPNPGNEPDDPGYPEDANVIYRIVDVNGLSEITIDVNDSITLYVDIASTTENNVWTFDTDVDISDPNLGSIDNTEYPGGTAQILAEPDRLLFADYWGPGAGQEEGIRLSGATFGSAIVDGHLASFVFTCEGQGDVTLELKNWTSLNTDNEAVFPKLETIVIHQIDPQMVMGMEGGMDEMLGTPETTSSESPKEIDIDELVSWLEELWSEDKEIKKTYSRTEWNDFIDSIKNLYE
ncbi:MAG: dockerin type I domain-containing protein [Planctomycetota bacterium]